MNQVHFFWLSTAVILAFGFALTSLILALMHCHPNSRQRRRDIKEAESLGIEIPVFLRQKRDQAQAEQLNITVKELYKRRRLERTAKNLGVTVRQLSELR